MRVRFEGFGPNFATGMLVFLVAVILASFMVLAKPSVAPDGSQADAAVVSPCKPYAWRERSVAWKYSPPLNEVWVEARLRYNGCEVYVISSTLDCWSKGGIYVVTITSCSAARVNLNTAYGQNVIVKARFQISILWSGFPIGTSAISCRRYDRNGILIGQSYGPYEPSC